jgi:multidrug efflux pump subunit AcrB
MVSKFFLDRPVFAWVIAIVMMSAGGLAIYNLPISQYPPIAPPSIAIDAYYPGASAETVENTVTQIIEQKMTGLADMLYLSGESSSSGTSRIELTFAPGTDPDLAWSKVQNKLQLAMASLPDVVQRQGVEVSKSTRNYLIMVGLVSEDGSMNGDDLRDYAQSNLEKILSRVPGVGEVEAFGSQYAMRVWIDPDKLTNFHLTMEDVIGALQVYNVEVSAGQFGGAPAVEGQRLNAAIVVQHLLQTPEEFAAIPIRTNPDGSVWSGSATSAGRNWAPSAMTWWPIQRQARRRHGHPPGRRRQCPGYGRCRQTENGGDEPLFSTRHEGGLSLRYHPLYRGGYREVVKTLFEAVFLVFVIMYLFMGTFRATLIPTIAVPVVLLGTFAILGLFGFSINMLTMFAMVLAIGLLVDDAIVVVENVERIMAEEGLPPREATAKSMEQITSALIGIGLVLAAVFGPMAFFPGSTGVIYRQFSLTIAAAMLLSVVVALILTPVLCAALLKPVPAGHEPADGAVFFLRPFFRWFDRAFSRFRDLYVKLVGRVLAKKLRYLLVFVLIVIAMGYLFKRMPTAYLPDEDQGILLVQAVLPGNATLEQTDAVMDKVRDHFLTREKEAVESIMTIPGISFGGQGQNMGLAFVKLRDWELRQQPDLKVTAVAGRAMGAFSQIREAMVFAFPPPAVLELGNATGFDFQLLDRGGLGHDRLHGGPQPAAGHGGPGSAPGPGASQRHGGCARIPH